MTEEITTEGAFNGMTAEQFLEWLDKRCSFNAHQKDYVHMILIKLIKANNDLSKRISELEAEKKKLEAELAEAKTLIDILKDGMKKGTELYARLKFDDEPFTPYQLALQEVETLKSELAEKDKWIPIEERLPRVDGSYLVKCPDWIDSGYVVAEFDRGTGTWDYFPNGEMTKYVTHWKTLPAL